MVRLNSSNGFLQGGVENKLLEKAFLNPVPPLGGYTTLYGIVLAVKNRMDEEGTMDPATMTVNELVTALATESNVFKLVAPW